MTNEVEAFDMLWYGAYPPLLADHCGADPEAMIERIESSVAAYPWRVAPRLTGTQQRHLRGLGGPAGVCAALRPAPSAIGKDFFGTSWQGSLLGLAGVTVTRDEGLELNLLGLGFSIDVND